MGSNVQIRISEAEGSELDDEFVRLFDDGTGLTVETFNRDGFYNVIEWAISATLVVIVAKPFFTKFMEKLGEASAEGLIHLIARQYNKSKKANERLFSENDVRRITEDSSLSEMQKADIGRKLAPMEFNVHHVPKMNYPVCYRLVLPANLDENLLEQALLKLATDHETLFRSALELDLEIMPGMEYQQRTISIIYHADQNDWFHYNDYINHMHYRRGALPTNT